MDSPSSSSSSSSSSMDSYSYSMDLIPSIRVFQSEIISEEEAQDLPLDSIQIELTIEAALVFDVTFSLSVPRKETVVLDLSLLNDRRQVHRLLNPAFTRLEIDTNSATYEMMVDTIIERGLEIADSGYKGKVLHLSSVIEHSMMSMSSGMRMEVGIWESLKSMMLRKFKIEDGEEKEDYEWCSVCLEELKAGSDVSKVRFCSHSFHTKCIEKWLLLTRNAPKCPICRQGYEQGYFFD